MNLEDLKARFDDLKYHYTEIKNSAEQKAVTWCWATNSMLKLEPFYNEIHRFPYGRKLKDEPAEKSGRYQIGLDDAGNIVVERNYVSFENQYYETFITYERDLTESVHYSYSKEKEIINVHQYHYNSGRLVRLCKWAGGGCSELSYSYDNNRIIKITEEYRQHGFENETDTEYHTEYNDFGELDKITDQNNHTYYKRKDSKHNFSSLSKLLIEKMPHVIEQCLANENIDRKIFSIVILYGYENSFPPSIGIGYEDERQKWLSEKGDEARWFLWNPAEYSNGLISMDDIDSSLDNICDSINQMIAMENKEKKVADIFVDVCRNVDPGKFVKKECLADDFIIYPVDYELCDFNRNIKKLYGADFLKKLKEENLAL